MLPPGVLWTFKCLTHFVPESHHRRDLQLRSRVAATSPLARLSGTRLGVSHAAGAWSLVLPFPGEAREGRIGANVAPSSHLEIPAARSTALEVSHRPWLTGFQKRSTRINILANSNILFAHLTFAPPVPRGDGQMSLSTRWRCVNFAIRGGHIPRRPQSN